MKLHRLTYSFLVYTASVMVAAPIAAQTYTPATIPSAETSAYPNNFTGLLRTPQGTGSGAVVRSPRVVYSCAHVVFDETAFDPWLGSARWYRAWSFGSLPSLSSGQLLRSYFYFVGYATAARISPTSPDSYNYDFVVHYAYEPTASGGYAAYYNDGNAQLLSSRTKLITGYPSGNYPQGDSRRYLMHSTGPFSRPFTVRRQDYLGIGEVSTGAGNSGGPVWVSDGTGYGFAGVLVSGLQRSAGEATDSSGVYAVGLSSLQLIDAAVAASGGLISAPTITSQPTSRRVSAGQTAVFSVSASGPDLIYHWYVNGNLIAGATSSTLSLPNVTSANVGTYFVVVSNSGGQVSSTSATLAVDSAAPGISVQPSNVVVTSGQSATLSVVAAGTGPFTYQWRKDGIDVAGATGTVLTFPSAAPTNAGSYTVTVSNPTGTVTSSAATLTVTTLPVITVAPVTQSVAAGRAVTFSVTVTAVPAPTYQWRKDGVNIPGATGASLTLGNAHTPDAGSYTVVTTNAAGSVTSPAGVLTVNFSRLVNLSILTSISMPGDAFTMGYVVAGNRSADAQPVLVRAAGPSLGALGVPGTLADPKIEYFRGLAKLGENNDWGGPATLRDAMVAVGAFPYMNAASRDAAAVLSASVGDNSVKVSAADSSTGTVIAEIYDATPPASVSSTAPRLANVSVLKELGTGFTVGFVVRGNVPKLVLVRAIGPTLTTLFSIGGAVNDPQLALLAGQSIVAANDNWGGGAALTSAFASVGAFALPVGAQDASILATLQPGSYTVQVAGVAGSSGLVLVEIYEVP